MKIYPIETGNFKLDGGAMFGVVPKTIWQKTNPADSNNLIEMSMRCMLIEDGDRLILIDTGLGNKQSDKFFGYYYLWGNDNLDSSLAQYGFHKNDITDVFMTHLHFDHCGGSVQWNKNRTGYELAFKNATFWSNEDHWRWATQPNKREKASFLKENILPIEESGQLKFTSVSNEYILNNSELGFDIFFANGHTDKQMIPMIKYKEKTIGINWESTMTPRHFLPGLTIEKIAFESFLDRSSWKNVRTPSSSKSDASSSNLFHIRPSVKSSMLNLVTMRRLLVFSPSTSKS